MSALRFGDDHSHFVRECWFLSDGWMDKNQMENFKWQPSMKLKKTHTQQQHQRPTIIINKRTHEKWMKAWKWGRNQSTIGNDEPQLIERLRMNGWANERTESFIAIYWRWRRRWERQRMNMSQYTQLWWINNVVSITHFQQFIHISQVATQSIPSNLWREHTFFSLSFFPFPHWIERTRNSFCQFHTKKKK